MENNQFPMSFEPVINFSLFKNPLITFESEKDAITMLRGLTWGFDQLCPYCVKNGTVQKATLTSTKPTFVCGACFRTFNHRTGTVFQNLKVPMMYVFQAIQTYFLHPKSYKFLIMQNIPTSREFKIKLVAKIEHMFESVEDPSFLDLTNLKDKNA